MTLMSGRAKVAPYRQYRHQPLRRRHLPRRPSGCVDQAWDGRTGVGKIGRSGFQEESDTNGKSNLQVSNMHISTSENQRHLVQSVALTARGYLSQLKDFVAERQALPGPPLLKTGRGSLARPAARARAIMQMEACRWVTSTESDTSRALYSRRLVPNQV